jgi:phosphoribosylformylglycinamidine synthase I
MRRVGVLRFPGTNCDRDVFSWVEARGFEPHYLWHLDQFNEKDFDQLVIPGGFSYGDYLRSGALAALSPAMKSVKAFADRGGPVLGICNGFQILCEAHLLPGALVRNESRRFVDDWSDIQVVNANSQFGALYTPGTKLRLPIAHGDGRFYAPADDLKKIYDQGLVWLTYLNNHNGSVGGIAGVMNEKKNVAALMPHPERAIYPWMGGQDGWNFL